MTPAPRPAPERPSRRSAASSCSPASPDGNTRRVTAGAFVRKQSRFRGRPEGGPERHHLYVALACPWSQRAVIVRAVLGLEDALGISYADPYRDERGWAFTGGRFTDERQRLRLPQGGLRRHRPRLRRPHQRPRAVGQGGRAGSSPTSPPTSSDLRRVGRRRPLPGRHSAPRSTSSTSGSTASSRTASTAPGSPAPRRPTTRPSAASSPRSSGSRASSPSAATWPATQITLGRLAPAADAAALRRRLPHALPLQRRAADRVPEPDPLHDRPLPTSRTSPRRSRWTRSSATTTRPTTS